MCWMVYERGDTCQGDLTFFFLLQKGDRSAQSSRPQLVGTRASFSSGMQQQQQCQFSFFFPCKTRSPRVNLGSSPYRSSWQPWGYLHNCPSSDRRKPRQQKQLVFCRQSRRFHRAVTAFLCGHIYFFPAVFLISCFPLSSCAILCLFFSEDQLEKNGVFLIKNNHRALFSASAWQNGFVFSICSTFKRRFFFVFVLPCATKTCNLLTLNQLLLCRCSLTIQRNILLSSTWILTRDFNLLDNVIRQHGDPSKNKMDYIVVVWTGHNRVVPLFHLCKRLVGRRRSCPDSGTKWKGSKRRCCCIPSGRVSASIRRTTCFGQTLVNQDSSHWPNV